MTARCTAAVPPCTAHRSLLPKDAILAAFPCLVRLLGSEYCVVHSYAAMAIERLLCLREGATGGGALLLTPQDLGPNLQVGRAGVCVCVSAWLAGWLAAAGLR